MARLLAAFIFLVVVAAAAPPDGYYAGTDNLTGMALKERLHDVIDGQTVIPYADLFPALRALWEDPTDATKIRLIYGGAPALKTATTWNREHLWPRSRGVNPSTAPDGGPDDSDLFHVVPADANVNSTRSNLYFDISRVDDGGFKDPAHIEAPLCTRDSDSWQPPPGDRGDIARALFYMAVRYNGNESGTADLELLTAAPTGAQMANLAALLGWHAEDPPDDAERSRNDRIFTSYQHNRNPFIDHPEWVSAIWGTITGAPTVQVTASAPFASEVPGTPIVLTVASNTPAPAAGLTLSYSVTGSASSVDYILSGPGLNTAAQTITIPAGASSQSFTLTPVADNVKENTETLTITLVPQPGLDVIGGPAAIGFLDYQVLPRELLASWSFDAVPLPVNIPADLGTANVNTATWTGGISSFTGVAGQSLGLEGNSTTNSFIECAFSTAGWTNLRLTFSTRANASGSFTSGTWSWSTDGVLFTAIPGVNTVATGTVFQSRTLDLSGIPNLQNQPAVKLRYHLSGATNFQANNRIDDLVITGHRYSQSWLARFPALSGPSSAPEADPDTDALGNLQEWAFDLSPLAPSPAPPAILGSALDSDPLDNDVVKRWPTITFTRRIDSPRLLVFPEQSLDLITWTNDCVLMGSGPGPTADSQTVTFRSSFPIDTYAVFLRLRIAED